MIFTDEEEFLYVGEMDENDEFNGFGTIYIREYGFKLDEGYFLKGKLHGFAKCYYAMKETLFYCGKYLNGMREGYGAEYYDNGKLKLRCRWSSSKPCSKFYLQFNENGSMIKPS